MNTDNDIKFNVLAIAPYNLNDNKSSQLSTTYNEEESKS
jgi:hypothetical protein